MDLKTIVINIFKKLDKRILAESYENNQMRILEMKNSIAEIDKSLNNRKVKCR